MSAYVFLHGFTGAPSSWDGVRAHLGAHRALALRLYGHLAEGAREAPRAFADELDDLAARILDAGFVDAHLVGYSLGARFGLGLLVEHGSLFAGATLVGVHPGLADDVRAERLADDERWARRLDEGPLEAFVEAWEAQPLWETQRRLPDDVRAAERRRRLGHTASGLASSLRSHGLGRMPDWRPRLGEVAVPVTLVAGGSDRKFVDVARAIAPSLGRARVATIDAIGHNVALEAPRELARLLEVEP